MLMLPLVQPIIALWVGDGVKVSMPLVMSMAAFTVISLWNSVFASLVNGVGKLKLQMVTATVGMLANIPLSLLLVKYYGMGMDGIVWATFLSLLPFAILAPVQVRNLLVKRSYETS